MRYSPGTTEGALRYSPGTTKSHREAASGTWSRYAATSRSPPGLSRDSVDEYDTVKCDRVPVQSILGSWPPPRADRETVLSAAMSVCSAAERYPACAEVADRFEMTAMFVRTDAGVSRA